MHTISETPTGRRSLLSKRLIVGVFFTLGALLWPDSGPSRGWPTLWWNWGHAVLFGGLSSLVLWELRQSGSSNPLKITYAIAGVIAFSVAAEFLQPLTGRHSDWGDVVISIYGVGAGSMAVVASWQSGVRRWLALLASFLFLVGSASALIGRVVATIEKRAHLPVIADFSESSAFSLWTLEHEGSPQTLRKESSEAASTCGIQLAADGHTALHHTVLAGAWSRFKSLRLQGNLHGSPPLHLGLRLDGAAGEDQRLYCEVHLGEGSVDARFIFPDNTTANEVLRHVTGLTLFTVGDGNARLLTLQKIWLE